MITINDIVTTKCLNDDRMWVTFSNGIQKVLKRDDLVIVNDGLKYAYQMQIGDVFGLTDEASESHEN